MGPAQDAEQGWNLVGPAQDAEHRQNLVGTHRTLSMDGTWWGLHRMLSTAVGAAQDAEHGCNLTGPHRMLCHHWPVPPQVLIMFLTFQLQLCLPDTLLETLSSTFQPSQSPSQLSLPYYNCHFNLQTVTTQPEKKCRFSGSQEENPNSDQIFWSLDSFILGY